MGRIGYLLAVAALFIGDAAAATPPPSCPVPGELIHWQADYCMFKIGTDDVIAAGPCLERELQVRPRSSCSGKFRYKRALCELVVGAGQRKGSIDSCVRDPLFMGPTVRNGGA
jgi:hypothetical protein